MIQILSIDDSKAVHSYLGTIFGSGMSQLWHAYDGQQGLELLGSQTIPSLDLILLDWEMPKLSGLETLKRIRERGVTIPVVMLTSKNDPAQIQAALDLGANEYVMKPFTPDILIQKLEMILNRKLV